MSGSTETQAFNPDRLSPARLWGLALAGILAEANNERHDTLFGSAPSDRNKWRVQKYILERDWGIRTKEDLLKILDDFPAQNPVFLGMRNFLETLDMSRRKIHIDSLRERNRLDCDRLTLVNNSLGRWSRDGILAWDQGRVAMLCRWSALTGLLDEREAWDRVMAAARLVQPAYRDWLDYGMHYIAGRQFWQGNLSVEHANLQMSRMKNLLLEGSGIWDRLPWGVELS